MRYAPQRLLPQARRGRPRLRAATAPQGQLLPRLHACPIMHAFLPIRLPLQGTLQDHTVLQDRLRRILGDLTFAEAYQRSGAPLGCVAAAWAGRGRPPRLRCGCLACQLSGTASLGGSKLSIPLPVAVAGLPNERTCPLPPPPRPAACAGRILNVSVSAADTSEPPRLLNYLTAPNVSAPALLLVQRRRCCWSSAGAAFALCTPGLLQTARLRPACHLPAAGVRWHHSCRGAPPHPASPHIRMRPALPATAGAHLERGGLLFRLPFPVRAAAAAGARQPRPDRALQRAGGQAGGAGGRGWKCPPARALAGGKCRAPRFLWSSLSRWPAAWHGMSIRAAPGPNRPPLPPARRRRGRCSGGGGTAAWKKTCPCEASGEAGGLATRVQSVPFLSHSLSPRGQRR